MQARRARHDVTGAPRRIHLDTDLGSDTDDVCALALLLGWEGAALAGVTTNTDPGGVRAGLTDHVLRLAGRADVPVAAGAAGTISELFVPLAFPDYWPSGIRPRPGAPGDALELLEANAAAGATVVAIGPFTNLALLEAARPGLLASTEVVVMGGHVTEPRAGLPRWGARDDFNVQQDRYAAHVVLRRCSPVVVPLAVTMEVHLRGAHLGRLRAAGPLARLIADQAELHARDQGRTDLGRSHTALPDDLLNFQYDPLACAIALGWDGAGTETVPTRLDLRDDVLEMARDDAGTALRVATSVDARGFEEVWLRAVERASAPQG
ncbi:MAG TPA: nucleoside hydrolase [Actinomycetota bacterium]|nr:nucleoside hydrolase [Actinomycetota bacterium]